MADGEIQRGRKVLDYVSQWLHWLVSVLDVACTVTLLYGKERNDCRLGPRASMVMSVIAILISGVACYITCRHCPQFDPPWCTKYTVVWCIAIASHTVTLVCSSVLYHGDCSQDSLEQQVMCTNAIAWSTFAATVFQFIPILPCFTPPPFRVALHFPFVVKLIFAV